MIPVLLFGTAVESLLEEGAELEVREHTECVPDDSEDPLEDDVCEHSDWATDWMECSLCFDSQLTTVASLLHDVTVS